MAAARFSGVADATGMAVADTDATDSGTVDATGAAIASPARAATCARKAACGANTP